MRHKKTAFTILEVIITLATLSACMTIFLRWQSISVTGIWQGWTTLEHISVLTTKLQSFMHDPTKPVKAEKIVGSKTTYNVATVAITPKSAFKEFAKELTIVRATASWEAGERSDATQEKLTLMTLIPSALLQKKEQR